MQIAGLISAMMAMIVTVALGFLLEPLPRVRLTCLWREHLKCVCHFDSYFGESSVMIIYLYA